MIAGRERGLTGAHVLTAFAAFFAFVLLVNLTMAAIATRSWTGLVAANGYVESQRFNDRLAASRAQARLGWRGGLDLDGRRLAFELRDAAGAPVPLAAALVTLERPVGEHEDPGPLAMAVAGGRAVLDRPLPAGAWNVRIEAVARSGETFRLDDRIAVRGRD